MTYLELCQEALRKIGVLADDEQPTADMIETARRGLVRLLRSWHNKHLSDWTDGSQQVVLTTAASYTLTTRAQRVRNVNFRSSGIDLPMEALTRTEYDELPDKAATGIPTSYYYDKEPTQGVLYVWPVLAAANGETLEVTQADPFADIVLSDASLIPIEWEEAVVYKLGERLADDYTITLNGQYLRTSMEVFEDALGADRPDSVYFIERDGNAAY